MLKRRAFRIISFMLVLCVTLMTSAYAFSSNYSGFNKNKDGNCGFGKHADYMIHHGIMKGNGKGDFSLNDYVKRGDIAVMIVRAFKFSAIVGDNFPDVSVDSYYYDAIATAKYHGIAKGDGKNFHPQKYVTVAQAIAFIERAASVANSNVVIDNTVDLHDLYSKGGLSKYATRKDVADMLYYILTGDASAEESTDLDAIEYASDENTPIKFNADDFGEVFEEAFDSGLSYVKFRLPSSSYGKLYFKSSSVHDLPVDENTGYYADPDDGRDLSKVFFAPYANYTGVISIKYTAYDKHNNSGTGTILITVKKTDEISAGTVQYATDKNTAVAFDAEDFSDAFEEATGDALLSVKFKLPSPSYGKLCYNYRSPSDYDSLVTESKSYYADPDDGRDLSKVFFVPYADFTGTVSIKYTACDKDTNAVSGTILITVKKAGDILIDTVQYTTDKNTAVVFDAEDFSDAFEEATGDALLSVKFKLPSPSYGKLCYNYSSSSDYGSLVTELKSYYADPDDGRDLSNVAFAPYSGYTGTFYINYTAYDADAIPYAGKIRIAVEEN